MITDNPVLAKACAFQHRGALLLNKSHIPYSSEKEIHCATKSLVEGIELQLKDVLKFKSHEAIYQPNAASSNSQVFTSSLAQSLESDRTNGIIFLHQTCVEAFELIDEKINEDKNLTDQFKGIISGGTMYLSPLGAHLRVASMGEVDGWNQTLTSKVDAAFRSGFITF
ncbi:hypothetical protein FRACYDRAFT_244733 [Fragilariopsis cylindrus CCMP1102]|uniref:Uncharacterized protein n=1 Tax=Fragilariopsis cylindrus CCMP1102 TaxID=635003 RepID=A0A1E7F0N2_9STRA|nr:hypothetical protein FRACYDRAFT_244733 [Fragilariopsis cylindrus CCMP1102]|eukprot:OEU11615.1 hypothetical protein FRACYDRAFT_244733 [Fragilariopsis cylindrus CCMP1102]